MYGFMSQFLGRDYSEFMPWLHKCLYGLHLSHPTEAQHSFSSWPVPTLYLIYVPF